MVRQKTYSIDRYGNDKDGGVSLVGCTETSATSPRTKLAQDPPVDPSIEKQFERHRQAAERPFGEDIDGWLAEKKTEKIKRGKLVAVRSATTNALHALWAGYLKARFGKLYWKDIKRADVLAYFRSMQNEGKLETRDRVRNIGEQVSDWADVEGDGHNPFRAIKKRDPSSTSRRRDRALPNRKMWFVCSN